MESLLGGTEQLDVCKQARVKGGRGLPVKLMLSLRMSPPPEGMEAQHVLEEGSMTIGRSGDATWTIPDPTRVISKQHCRIDATPRGFTITDTSTNGAFVNEQPIGSQSTRLLSDGDVVRLGNIVIAAGIQDAGQPVSGISLPPDGPFGEKESLVETKLEAPEPMPAARGPIAEDWWKQAPPAGAESAKTRFDPKQPPPIADAIVVSLIESFPGLDVTMLAQGVDVAGAVVGDREWQAFYERLRSYLRERYPESA
jgi:pSer/pThr/pTyr-binding forkhead associated (FHA) protein